MFLSAQEQEFATLHVALLLGIVAFILRIYGRPVYAILEIVFGTIGGGVALSMLYKPDALSDQYKQIAQSTTHFSLYVGLGSAIFIIVRGLDNLSKK